ncbi:MAG: hypothetical protein AABZ39_17325 [Spirochaetota bacterium]
MNAIRLQGYNMIRIQGMDMVLSVGAQNDGDLNAETLERFDRLVFCLKQAGIYITLDMAYHASYLKGRWDEGDQRNFRERFLVDPSSREPWANGVRAFLTHRNPYTGLSLADDPVMATMTFWNEQDIFVEIGFFQKPDIKPFADKRWRDFLRKRYNDRIEALRDAWGTAEKIHSFEDIGFEKAYPLEYTTRGNDAAVFVYELQAEMTRWYENTVRETGYKGLTHQYDAIIRFRNHAARNISPVVSMHTYHNHPKGFNTPGSKMEQNGAIATSAGYWRIAANARYLDRPMFVTENNFGFWGKYRHEAGLLYPSYSAFQGFSGLTVHCQPVIMGLAYPMGVYFAGRDPIQRANQVLATLLFARGDVSPSASAVKVLLSKEYLFSENNMLKKINDSQSRISLLCRFGLGSDMPAPAGVPAVQAKMTIPPESGGEMTITTHAVAASDSATSGSAQWVEQLRKAGLLSSDNRTSVEDGVFQTDTKEILMNVKEESLTVITSKTEGAVLKEDRSITLKNIRIDSMPAASAVAVSSLDGAPIDRSKRLLLVYSTDALNTDFEASDDRVTLVKLGTLPVLMRTGALSVTIKNTQGKAMTLWALGIDGSRKEQLPIAENADGKMKIVIDTAKLKDGPTPFFELAAE